MPLHIHSNHLSKINFAINNQKVFNFLFSYFVLDNKEVEINFCGKYDS